MFYHPDKVNGHGDVIFNTDLVKMKISIENDEKIFKKAIKVLKGKIPKAHENCKYCEWAKSNN